MKFVIYQCNKGFKIISLDKDKNKFNNKTGIFDKQSNPDELENYFPCCLFYAKININYIVTVITILYDIKSYREALLQMSPIQTKP